MATAGLILPPVILVQPLVLLKLMNSTLMIQAPFRQVAQTIVTTVSPSAVWYTMLLGYYHTFRDTEFSQPVVTGESLFFLGPLACGWSRESMIITLLLNLRP